MKNLKFIAKFIVLLLLVFSSCNKDTELAQDLIVAAEPENEPGVYCGTEVQFRNPHDHNHDHEEGADSRQRVFDDVPITDVDNLTIFIDDCFDNLNIYQDAIDDAIEAYNNVPCTDINITIVTNQNNADIIIDCLPGNRDDCGLGGVLGGTAEQFFDGNANTNSLLINSALAEMVQCCGQFGQCDLTGLIIHEIGHVIGLAHTNQGSDPNFPSTLIAGTPNGDANSIFNGNSLCAGICDFSADDIVALQTLYPNEPAQLTLSITGLCCDPTPDLFNDDCQTYHAYATPNAGNIVNPSWTISPMTGVTIYDNSETENMLKFSFDDTVINGDDFVIYLTATIDCINDETLTVSKLVEVYSCEGEEGGDQ